ncbi:MAG: tRNA (adenosine(37)-N6)-threonylcarbamoyltransferase complex ATPase subunit type 1 TsaE [Thermoanaerobaculales bacterium]|jgi:tRNA threonylcarbamoyl adenosine modification protein YjeE|nr:tRNA (adenosine(37)-N6)-threonylcarbamoyltransferase complex ATPase subunit type 1 TsaE [Thermoanaerobaculales bacterium]
MSGPPSEVLDCPAAADTEAVGESLAARLLPGDVVLLEGDLAAGKTTLVRGLVRGLGGDAAEVSSPTFVLLVSHPCGGRGIGIVHHVDLYRLGERVRDLREIGVEEALSDPEAVTAVEWPKDVLATWIPADARVWRVVITTGSDDVRRVVVRSPGSRRRPG